MKLTNEEPKDEKGGVYDLASNKIGFYCDVNRQTVSEFIEMLMSKARILSKQKKQDKKLYIFIRSPGGCLFSAFAAYDHIRSIGKHLDIVTVAEGHIASGATLMFCAGNERYAMRSSTFLFHQLTTMFSGKYIDLTYEHRQCVLLMKKLSKIYMANSSMSLASVETLLSKELVMSSNKCKKRGFVTGWYD